MAADWAETAWCRWRAYPLLREETLRRDGVWGESAFGLNTSNLRHLSHTQVRMSNGSEKKSGLKLVGGLV